MTMVDVDDSSLQVDLQPSHEGNTVLDSSDERDELPQRLCHDGSIINIVLVHGTDLYYFLSG